jgi:transposase InsO family protein
VAKPRDDEQALVKRMLHLVRQRPRFGYRRIAALLRAESWRASSTRIYRLWRREGLKVPQKKRKRRRLGKSENGCHRRRALHKDHVWCWDFVFDHTTSGSTLKWLSIVDEPYTLFHLIPRPANGVHLKLTSGMSRIDSRRFYCCEAVASQNWIPVQDRDENP